MYKSLYKNTDDICCQLCNLAILITLNFKVPMSNFNHEPNISKAQYRKFLDKHGIDVSQAYLMHIKPKPDADVPIVIRPFSNSGQPDQPSDKIRTNIHFEYFNRQLCLNSKSLADFLTNFFVGFESSLVQNDDENGLICAKTLKKKSKGLSLEEEVALFNMLRNWTGYEMSVFCNEADNFVDSTFLV